MSFWCCCNPCECEICPPSYCLNPDELRTGHPSWWSSNTSLFSDPDSECFHTVYQTGDSGPDYADLFSAIASEYSYFVNPYRIRLRAKIGYQLLTGSGTTPFNDTHRGFFEMGIRFESDTYIGVSFTKDYVSIVERSRDFSDTPLELRRKYWDSDPYGPWRPSFGRHTVDVEFGEHAISVRWKEDSGISQCWSFMFNAGVVPVGFFEGVGVPFGPRQLFPGFLYGVNPLSLIELEFHSFAFGPVIYDDTLSDSEIDSSLRGGEETCDRIFCLSDVECPPCNDPLLSATTGTPDLLPFSVSTSHVSESGVMEVVPVGSSSPCRGETTTESTSATGNPDEVLYPDIVRDYGIDFVIEEFRCIWCKPAEKISGTMDYTWSWQLYFAYLMQYRGVSSDAVGIALFLVGERFTRDSDPEYGLIETREALHFSPVVYSSLPWPGCCSGEEITFSGAHLHHLEMLPPVVGDFLSLPTVFSEWDMDVSGSATVTWPTC